MWRIGLPGSPITCTPKRYKTERVARAVAMRWAKRWLRPDVELVAPRELRKRHR